MKWGGGIGGNAVRAAMLAIVVSASSSFATGPALDSTPPADITVLTAVTGTNAGEVSLTWTAVGDDGLIGTAQAYLVRYASFNLAGLTSGQWWGGSGGPVYSYSQSWAPAAPGTTENRVAGGLTEGVTFYFGVLAKDSHGNQSSLVFSTATNWSAVRSSPPAAPVVSAAQGTLGGRITFSFTHTGDNGMSGLVTTYLLYRSTWAGAVTGSTAAVINGAVTTVQTSTTTATLIPKTPGTADTYIAMSLSPGATHYFRLEARDVGNAAISAEVSAAARQDDTRPNPVTSLSVAAGGADGTVDVTWVYAPDQDISLPGAYIIRYATWPFQALNAAHLAATTLGPSTTPQYTLINLGGAYSTQTVNIAGLARRQTYYFAVISSDTAGLWQNGRAANTSDAVTVVPGTAKDGAAPATITGISALPQAAGGAVQLTWVAPGDDGVSTGPAVASYAIKYATYPPVSALQADVTTWWANSQGSAAPWMTNRFVPVPKAPGQVETHVVTGLGNPTTRYYFVIGSSDAGGNFSALTLSTAASAGTVSADLLSPSAVTNLTGLRDPVVKSTINLTWTAPADPNSDVATYAVKWSTFGTSPDTTGWWNGAISTIQVNVAVGITTVSAPGVTENRQLTGMPTVPITMMIRSSDAANNVSSVSSFLTVAGVPDTTPPGQIGDLKVSSVSITAVSTLYSIAANTPAVGKVHLTWTAPGDDGTAGTVSSVLVRYSTGGSITTEAAWSTSTVSLSPPPSVLASGAMQSYVVTDLTVGTTYYFAVRGQDAAGNLGALSSGTVTWCTPNQVIPISYLVTLDTNGVSSHLNEYYAIAPASITSVLSTTSGIVADGSGRSIQVVRLSGDHTVGAFLGTPNPAMGTRIPGVAGMVTHNSGQMQLRDVYDYQGSVFPFTTFNLPPPIEKTAIQLPVSATQATQDVSLPEATEHMLVALRRVSLVNVATNTWPAGISGSNIQVQESSGVQATVRFDAGTNMSGTIAPDLSAQFDVIGTQGQFDTSSPYFGGYQIFPPSATLTGKGIGIIERPRGLSALPGNLAVTLTWTAVTDPNRNGFKIYSSTAFPNPTWTVQIDTPTAGLTAITVTSGLTPGTTFYFYVGMKQAVSNSWQIAPSANGAFQESGPPLADSLGLPAAANEVGWVGFGDRPDTVAPSSPTAVSATPATSVEGGVALSWTAPGNDGAVGTATKYLIRYATWPAGGPPDVTSWFDGQTTPPTGARQVDTYRNLPAPQVSGSAEALTVSGLVVGATYYIAIRAVDGAGNISTNSALVNAYASNLAPTAPTNLSAAAVGGAVTLTWTAPTVPGQFGEAVPLSDVSSGTYRVYYNEGRSGWRVITGGANDTGAYDNLMTSVSVAAGISVNGSSRTSTLGGLKNGVTYYFVVAAMDASGRLGTATTEVSAAPTAPPAIKITEVMLYGPNDGPGWTKKDQFIEIYNASDAPADISQWYLTYRSLSGTLNNNFVRTWFPPGTVLAGRAHYVIGFVENTGLYRAGVRAGVSFPLADYDSGNPETLDAANEKAASVWPAGQGPGTLSFGMSQGVALNLLTPAAAVDKTTLGNWKISATGMAGQPVVDRITLRGTSGTAYVFWNANSDGSWPDGNGKYFDTETDNPPGAGPLFETRPSSSTLSFQRKDENVDNDRLDDWTVRTANPGVGGDLAPPAVPGGLTAIAAVSDSVVQVSWSPNTESDLKDYGLYRATWTSSLQSKVLVARVAQPGTTHQDAGFTNETPVFYQMTARDASLNESAGSAEAYAFVRDTLAPPAPVGVGVAGFSSGGALRLAWSASPAPDLKDYRVWRATYSPVGIGGAFSPAVVVVAPGTTHQDGGLTNATTYYYRLTARDVSLNESGGATEVSGIPTADSTPPAVPAGLGVVTAAAGGAAAMSWTANTEGDLKDYGVSQATWAGASPAPTPTRILAPGTTHQAAGLTNGTTYYFRLTARDTSLNESGGSADISVYVKDGTPPAAPTGLQVGNLGASAVKVWWLASAEGDLKDYGVYRATTAGGVDAAPTRILAPGTTHQAGGLINGATYFYRITARDTSLNESPGSSEASVTVSADTVPPSGVTNLSASSGVGGLMLTWMAPGNDGTVGTAASYEIRFATWAIAVDSAWAAATVYGQSWAPLASGATESRSLSGLSPNSTYYVNARARDGGGNLGTLSNTATGYVYPPLGLVSINAARGAVNANGEPLNRDRVYTIRGIVTAKKGVMNVNSASSDATIFVQDETAGIPVYDENNQAFPAEVKEGDFVEIKGRVGFFKGITELHPQTLPGTNIYADPTDDPTGRANFTILGSSASPPALTTGGGVTLASLLPLLESPYTVVTASQVGVTGGVWDSTAAEALDGKLVRLTGVQQIGIVTSIVEDDVGTLPSTSAAPGGTFVNSWVPGYARNVVQDGTGRALLFVSERTDLRGPVYSSTGGVIGYVPAPLPPSTSSVDVVGVLWQRYSPVSIATKYLAYYNIGLRYIGRVSGQVTVGGAAQAGALVEVLQSSAVVAWSTTGSDGRYEVALGTTTTAAPSSSTVRVTVSGRTPITTEARLLALGERWVRNVAFVAAPSSQTKMVDPASGGTVTNADVPGTQVVVPAGTFTVPVQVTIATIPVAVPAETIQAADAAEAAPAGAILVDAALADTIREIRALDAGGVAQQPAKDVTLTISFNSLRVRAAYVPLLRIFRLNETSKRWELAAAADRQVVDAAGGWVSAPVAHFSVFRLAVYRAPAVVLDQVRVFPNPVTFASAVRSTVKLDQLTAQPTVRVYTLTGDLVREIPAGTPIQTDGTVNAGNSGVAEWGGTNADGVAVARGTYVMLITDDKGGRVVRKLAVLK